MMMIIVMANNASRVLNSSRSRLLVPQISSLPASTTTTSFSLSRLRTGRAFPQPGNWNSKSRPPPALWRTMENRSVWHAGYLDQEELDEISQQIDRLRHLIVKERGDEEQTVESIQKQKELNVTLDRLQTRYLMISVESYDAGEGELHKLNRNEDELNEKEETGPKS